VTAGGYGDQPAIAVIGAGLIGRRHAALVAGLARLAAIVDPTPEAEAVAAEHGVPWHADLVAYLADHRPDGAIIATPNQLHAAHGMACVEAGVPMLIEKPVVDRSEAGERLIAAAQAAGVPILVGHHRRHNPLIAAAKAAIDAGRLGEIVSVSAQFWLYKPDDYFAADWRGKGGAGPVLINLIHDIDLMRHLCGEITGVQAIESNRRRGRGVEDTAAILLEFECGALGTATLSDTIVAPWSWEFTAGENPAYPHVASHCYTIGGTEASLSIPDLRLWFHPGTRSWWEPIESERLDWDAEDPLVRQTRHFAEVIAGRAAPLVSGREGLATLRVVEAIKAAAATGGMVRPGGGQT